MHPKLEVKLEGRRNITSQCHVGSCRSYSTKTANEEVEAIKQSNQIIQGAKSTNKKERYKIVSSKG